MHVDNILLSSQFSLKSSLYSSFIFKVKDLNRILGITCVIISQKMRDQKTLKFPTRMKSHVAFQLTYLYLTFVHFKVQGRIHAYFDCEHLKNGKHRANIAIAFECEVADRLLP